MLSSPAPSFPILFQPQAAESHLIHEPLERVGQARCLHARMREDERPARQSVLRGEGAGNFFLESRASSRDLLLCCSTTSVSGLVLPPTAGGLFSPSLTWQTCCTASLRPLIAYLSSVLTPCLVPVYVCCTHALLRVPVMRMVRIRA